jgi:hypothetical protein
MDKIASTIIILFSVAGLILLARVLQAILAGLA